MAYNEIKGDAMVLNYLNSSIKMKNGVNKDCIRINCPLPEGTKREITPDENYISIWLAQGYAFYEKRDMTIICGGKRMTKERHRKAQTLCMALIQFNFMSDYERADFLIGDPKITKFSISYIKSSLTTLAKDELCESIKDKEDESITATPYRRETLNKEIELLREIISESPKSENSSSSSPYSKW